MASKNIIAKGTTYNGVESVTLPVSGGGSATFYEISDTTAVAADVDSSKWFYTALGVLTQGTASGGGGGGGSNWTLLASEEFTASTTSTSTAIVGSIQLQSLPSENEILLVHIRDKAGKRNGYFYGTDAIWLFPNGNRPTNANPPTYVICYTSDAYSMAAANTGLYPYQINSSLEIVIRSRYSNTSSLTVDGTYKCDVYKLTLPSGMTLFT